MTKLIATTAVGLEEIAAQDLRDSFGLPALAARNGAVSVSLPGPAPRPEVIDAIKTLNYWSRSLNRVGIVLCEGPCPDLDACYQLALSADYSSLIDADQRFAIRPQRKGCHPFTSIDLGRAVGQAVIDSFSKAKGKRLAVDLDEPEVILRAGLHGDEFCLWLDTTGDMPLHRRSYRKQYHPASLMPSLAYLMLRIANWTGGPLIDPMCGIATIPIEAALYARGIPPGQFRTGGWAYERLRWLDSSPQATTTRSTAVPSPLVAQEKRLEILGIERFDRHLQGAWLNIAEAGLNDELRVVQGDAADLEAVLDDSESYPVAVLNPPYGRRIGSRGQTEILYGRFCQSAQRSGIRRIVVITELLRAMERSLRDADYQITAQHPVMYGDLRAVIFVAEQA
jgi:tRNA (guanine6-N2)-methyltransferase